MHQSIYTVNIPQALEFLDILQSNVPSRAKNAVQISSQLSSISIVKCHTSQVVLTQILNSRDRKRCQMSVVCLGDVKNIN